MSKPRIAIRAFTCRRDVAGAELLARVLENLGCSVLVTSIRDFERTLRLWRPEVAIINSRGKVSSTKSRFPEVAAVFLDGEGHMPEHITLAKTLARNKEMYRAMDLVLLWGEIVRNEICQLLPDEDHGKMHVVGNPAYDLIRYRPASLHYDPTSKSIGFVGRFNAVNSFSGVPAVRYLSSKSALDQVIVQSRGCLAIVNAARHILENSDLSVSIRPHPLEQVESYQSNKRSWFGDALAERVEIDDSLCFGHWAVNQRAIISPTSTSFLEAYMLKVPVINIDELADTAQFNKDYAKLAEEWQDAGAIAHDYPHLMALLSTNLPKVKQDATIERQLREYCDTGTDESACLRAARVIADFANSGPRRKGFRLPTPMVDALDEISFRRVSRRDPLHQRPNLTGRIDGEHPPELFIRNDEDVNQFLSTFNSRKVHPWSRLDQRRLPTPCHGIWGGTH